MIKYIIITIIILGFLILSHELGHFLAARMFNVKVNEFAIGMGPTILKKETSKTTYSLRLLPIGGFCSLQEDEGKEIEEVRLLNGDIYEVTLRNKCDPNESFTNKPAWQRFIILGAGVFVNIIVAILILMIALILMGADPLTAITRSFILSYRFGGLIFQSIRMLIVGEVPATDLTGPVGMVQVVHDYSNYGLSFLLFFTAMLSINLAIVNLIPVPALDGGQMLILIVEKIKGGEISESIKNTMFVISYILIMLLTIFVFYNDIIRIFN